MSIAPILAHHILNRGRVLRQQHKPKRVHGNTVPAMHFGKNTYFADNVMYTVVLNNKEPKCR